MTPEDSRSRTERLEGALAALEAAVARVAGAERTRADLAESLAAMDDDRRRLAAELDAALARARAMERASEAVEQRLAALAQRVATPAADAPLMAQVVVTIAGRTYRMHCEDGQEPHLERLARDVDARMGNLRQSFGEIGDQRLVVMTALTIADELDGAQQRLKDLEAAADARVASLEALLDATTARVAQLVDALDAAKG